MLLLVGAGEFLDHRLLGQASHLEKVRSAGIGTQDLEAQVVKHDGITASWNATELFGQQPPNGVERCVR